MNNLSNFQVPDIWEVKDVVNKLKNVMLNYTEMEAKVHDATNNEPWGASTTLMQEIAQGTFNYQYFNEIMPTIYRRFTEKEPKQWRQIYKALVLLEYLIKNGSERVIDDARSHVSLIKVLRNFYYIDEKGKDEGINVRNRSKEIIELLSNTEKIRTERKLAKKNRNKYVGVGSDGMGSIGSSSRSMGGGPMMGGAGPSRFVGFGSDSYASGGGGISFNGDAYSFGEETPYPHQTSKYDIDDDDDDDVEGGYRSDDQSSSNKKSSDNVSTKKKDDDDDWGDFTWGETSTQQETKPAANNSSLFDDDFDDFQQAPEVPKAQATQQPPAQKHQDLFDLLGDTANPTSPLQQQQQQQPMNLFESTQPMTPTGSQQKQQQQQQQATQPQSPKKEEDKSDVNLSTGMWAQASNFVSLDSLGKKVNQPTSARGPSMNAMKSTSVQADWNNWANKNSKPSTPATTTTQSSPFDDLLG